MIKLSRLSDYAITILCAIAAQPKGIFSASSLSDTTKISNSTVMKILKLLAKAQILSSARGAKGGYILVQEPNKLDILAIVRAIDGPVNITQCTDPNNDLCAYKASCLAAKGWIKINREIEKTLSKFTINDFLTNN